MLTVLAGILCDGLLLHAVQLVLLHSLLLKLGLLTLVLLSNERLLRVDLLSSDCLPIVWQAQLLLWACQASLGHNIPCYVTPRNMSYYHMLCDTLQLDLDRLLPALCSISSLTHRLATSFLEPVLAPH